MSLYSFGGAPASVATPLSLLVTGLLSQTPIPTTLTNSTQVDVSGRKWVDFLIDVSGNGGGTPSTQLDGYVECSEDGSTWRRITVEEVAAGSGDATQYDYHWIRAFSGATFNTVLTVPVTALYMRLVVKGNATPDGASTLAVDAVLRSV